MNRSRKLFDVVRRGMQAGGVERWHTAVDIPAQSIAEHTFGVCMIANQIALQICKYESHSDLFRTEVFDLALHHDLGEWWTADLPWPLNQREEANGIRRLESAAVEKVFGNGETLISEETASPRALEIVKDADLLEMYFYLLRQIHRGNEAAKTYWPQGWQNPKFHTGPARDIFHWLKHSYSIGPEPDHHADADHKWIFEKLNQ